jgi:hypothetical protein
MKRFLLALLVAVGFAAPAQAWWTKGRTPPCDSGRVIASIKERFLSAERTFHFGVAINEVSDIYETPEQIVSHGLIGRRFCRGTAWLSDQSNSDLFYLIESKQGFASIGFRVTLCLPGFDPWHVYDGWCRSIQP